MTCFRLDRVFVLSLKFREALKRCSELASQIADLTVRFKILDSLLEFLDSPLGLPLFDPPHKWSIPPRILSLS